MHRFPLDWSVHRGSILRIRNCPVRACHAPACPVSRRPLMLLLLSSLTFAPAGSMQADYMLFREPGSRQREPMPFMAGVRVPAVVLVDGESVRFTGFEVPRLVVMLARRADHAIGLVSRGWSLAEISLATITDFASHESIELEDMRIVLRGAQIGLAEDAVVIHRGQPGDYVHTDGTAWTWLKRWRLAVGVHLRVYDLIE